MSKHEEQHFSALRAALAELGPFRRGSVQRRLMRCGKPRCACRASPPRLHGPYYQWTRKVKGKTVTVRLSQEQAGLLEQWVANARKLDKLVSQMERVSHRLTEPLLRAARSPSMPS